MAKIDKLIARLKTLPKDFTWDELTRILVHYEYMEMKQGKTGGSRRKFIGPGQSIISLHKPHPGNIVKTYALKQVIDYLKL
jgi:hypothetical protein